MIWLLLLLVLVAATPLPRINDDHLRGPADPRYFVR